MKKRRNTQSMAMWLQQEVYRLLMKMDTITDEEKKQLHQYKKQLKRLDRSDRLMHG